MAHKRTSVTPAVIEALAAIAGLPLAPERSQELATHLEAMLEDISRLDEVDVRACEPPISIPAPLHREKDR